MQFDQMNNFNSTNENIVKPKLIKKSNNVSTQKVEQSTSSTPPNNSSIGYEFTLNGQSLNNVEEKVAHLSLQMNQIIVKPYLQQALDYLRTSKRDSINAYNQLSDQIANEIRIISQNTQQISTSLKEAQDVVAKTQEIIRNKYNNAIEEDISSGALNLDYEYNIVAEHYELSLQLTQELSKYKSRIDSLLSTQSMLDEAIVPAISRLQIEIDNLELLLQCFDSSDYAEMLAKKTGKNVSIKKVPTNDFRTRAEEINRLAAAASINSLDALNQNNGVNLNNMNQTTNVANQRINTSAYNQTMNNNNQSMNNYAFNNMNTMNMSNSSNNMYQPCNNTNANYSNNINSSMNNSYSFNANNDFNNQNMMNNMNQMNNNQQFNNGLSRQELRMMKKLREQQMKFEHMMRMNELIFQYNRSVDEMILRQKEYELKHEKEFADANRIRNEYNETFNNKTSSSYRTNRKSNDDELNLYESKHIYESQIPLETLNENMKKSNVDKVFVVRQAAPITEDQAREIKNRGSVKSIRVVKK